MGEWKKEGNEGRSGLTLRIETDKMSFQFASSYGPTARGKWQQRETSQRNYGHKGTLVLWEQLDWFNLCHGGIG